MHKILLTVAAAFFSSSCVATAATLESYFDFRQYGSRAGGAEIISNLHGTAVGTLKGAGTAVNGVDGLSILPGHPAADTGMHLAGPELGSFTGGFTLQIWYVLTADALPDTMLYGGTTSPRPDKNITGDQALFVGFNNKKGRMEYLRPIVNDNTRYGIEVPTTQRGAGTKADTIHDYVLTYDGETREFVSYLDGERVGGLGAGAFGGLAALTDGISVGGVQSPAFPDNAAAVNVRSFIMYKGALTPGQVAAIHRFGDYVTIAELISAGVAVETGK